MNISEKNLELLMENLDANEMEVEGFWAKVTAQARMPIKGSDEEKYITVQFEIPYDYEFMWDDVNRALKRGNYDELLIIDSEYTEEELNKKLFLMNLAA